MKKYPLIFVFFGMITLVTVADIFNSSKEFSDLENRVLKEKPRFSIKKFANNTYSKDYEEYINDQFIFRDSWIDIKSKVEYALGKKENNNIVYGKDKYMFEKLSSIDENKFMKNANAVNDFAENINIPVTFMLVPNSYEVYNEKLPKGVPMVNQEQEINKAFSKVYSTNNIYLLDKFRENKDDYIYYKTDHHWTSYGAYLAYEEFCKATDNDPVYINNLNKHEVKDFYGTYFSKSKAFNSESDLITYYDIDGITMQIGDDKFGSLYDYDKVTERDKYALFLRGNSPLAKIKNSNVHNDKKILVVKDSYANSFVPFLVNNYSEVDVVDLRYFSENISEYIRENNFSDILVLYNFNSFSSDNNIVKLNY